MGKITLKMILGTVMAYIIAVFALLMPCEPDNITLTVDPVTTESESIHYTYVNETNRSISGDSWLHKFEKNVDGEWVEIPAVGIRTMLAYKIQHKMSHGGHFSIKSSLGLDNLEAGEYRMTIAFDVADVRAQETVTGYSTTTFTVTAAE